MTPAIIQPFTTVVYNARARAELEHRRFWFEGDPKTFLDRTLQSLRQLIRKICAIAIILLVAPVGVFYHLSSAAYYTLCSRIARIDPDEYYKGRTAAHIHCAHLDFSVVVPSQHPRQALITHPSILPRRLPETQRLAMPCFLPSSAPRGTAQKIAYIDPFNLYNHLDTPEAIQKFQSFLATLPSDIRFYAVNGLSYKDRPLQKARDKNNLTLVKLLIESGARHFFYDDFHSVLYGEVYAYEPFKSSRCTAYFLEQGANPLALTYRRTLDDRRIAGIEYESIALSLCERSSDDETAVQSLQLAKEYSTDPVTFVRARGPYMLNSIKSPLYVAVHKRFYRTTELLLNSGADANEAFGSVAEAWTMATTYTSASLARHLIERYDVNIDAVDQYGLTALHWAAALRCEPLRQLLHANGARADINSTHPYTMPIGKMQKMTKTIPAGLNYEEFAQQYQNFAALDVLSYNRNRCNYFGVGVFFKNKKCCRYDDSAHHKLEFNKFSNALESIQNIHEPLPGGNTLLHRVFKTLEVSYSLFEEDAQLIQLLLERDSNMLLALNDQEYTPLSFLKYHLIKMQEHEKQHQQWRKASYADLSDEQIEQSAQKLEGEGYLERHVTEFADSSDLASVAFKLFLIEDLIISKNSRQLHAIAKKIEDLIESPINMHLLPPLTRIVWEYVGQGKIYLKK